MTPRFAQQRLVIILGYVRSSYYVISRHYDVIKAREPHEPVMMCYSFHFAYDMKLGEPYEPVKSLYQFYV